MAEVRTYPALVALGDMLILAAGYLDAVRIKLYQNSIAITPAIVTADLVEASYTGYAASAALAWGAPYLAIDGNITLAAASVQFQPTGGAVTNLIYGYWVEKVAAPAAAPLLIGTFDGPVSLESALDALIVSVPYRLATGQ